ncbi:hypothetical protein [Labrenzia sp. R5_0]|nr:hypothetical protein [Labrenzia sp. R5_0]MBO9462471.1 hypothetical protein [Labrenzia sp. R5_0]
MSNDEDYELSPDERANLEAMARLVRDMTGTDLTKLSAEELASLLSGSRA